MASDVITNYAKNRIALMLGGSIAESIDYFIIGTGSSTVSPSDTTLANATDRQEVTSVSYPSLTKIKWQGDWNSVEISGTQLTEWGLITSGTGLTGSIWSRHVIPALTFDGSNELRIEEVWEIK